MVKYTVFNEMWILYLMLHLINFHWKKWRTVWMKCRLKFFIHYSKEGKMCHKIFVERLFFFSSPPVQIAIPTLINVKKNSIKWSNDNHWRFVKMILNIKWVVLLVFSIIINRFVSHQFHRLILFERLLRAYPYQKQRLYTEARKDIPPFYRAFVWSALLDVSVGQKNTHPKSEFISLIFFFSRRMFMMFTIELIEIIFHQLLYDN